MHVYFSSISTFQRSCAFSSTLALMLVFCLPVSVLAEVAKVSLSIGYSEVQAANGSKRTLRNADAISEGDTIHTSTNGHVHLRFVDGALISVRPNSVFSINEFKFSPGNPNATVIRLSMTQGEIRSISGAAAREARDRFRLNTPIVAIGVRGTDFVAQAKPDLTIATVNQGAIIMSPLDTNCRADGLGGCDGQRARVLTAEMSGLALVYRLGSFDPGFQNLQSLRDKQSLRSAPLESQSKENQDRAVNVVHVNSRPEELVSPSRLVWGRWPSDAAPGDHLTIGFREAMRGNDVTVGDGYYFLFRTAGGTNLLPSLRNQVDFKLTASSAFFRMPSNDLTPASVDAGRFSVDFASRKYETQLQVSALGIPSQNVEFRGNFDPNTGYFLGGSPQSRANLAGALSIEGRQAGYSFRIPVGLGSFQGATLWGR